MKKHKAVKFAFKLIKERCQKCIVEKRYWIEIQELVCLDLIEYLWIDSLK